MCIYRGRNGGPNFFWLSGPNERLSRFDQSDDEPASSGDSVMHSPRRKPWRRLTYNEKGKKKVLDSGTDRNKLDRHESESEESSDRSSRGKFVSAEKGSTSANEQLR